MRVNLHTRSYISLAAILVAALLFVASIIPSPSSIYAYSTIHSTTIYQPSIERPVDSRPFLCRSNKPNDTLDTEYRRI